MALTRSIELLTGLQDCLLTQVDAAEVDSIRDAASRPGGGLVLVGQDAIAKAAELAHTEVPPLMLVDRRRYAGKRRVPGTANFQPQWIWAQQHLRLPAVLTDSGYIGDNDGESLNSVLTQTARLDAGAVATLPLHSSWVERKQSQERLITAIRDAGVPVALVLEHASDPLAKKAALFGFVNVLQNVDVPVLVLSCDVSAVGAIAFGAHAAAVGTRSGLRHLYPPGAGGPTDGEESVFLREFLAFMKVGKVAKAVVASPAEPMWTCWCQSCKGQRLDWLLAATQSAVRCHSIELLADLRDQLTQIAAGEARKQAWRAWCASAQFQYDSLETYDVFWETPPAIRRWREVSAG